MAVSYVCGYCGTARMDNGEVVHYENCNRPRKANAGDLLLAAFDAWASHAQLCAFGPDECPDCRELFAKKALAYEVWKFRTHEAATQ